MTTQPNTDAGRRMYWTQQMDAAYAFMEEMMDYPVAECGEPLVALPEAAKAAGVRVLFSQTRLAGSFDRLFYVREGLVAPFIDVANELTDIGWTLRVEDGFRSTTMQKALALQQNILDAILRKVMWENHGAVPTPDRMFRRLTALVATCPKIGTHMSGTAIDISVVRSDDLSEVDRGKPYLEMSELTPMDSPFVSATATENRVAITQLMQRHGFIAYPYEFWHYSQGDAYASRLAGIAPPARYGPIDFDPVSRQVTPIARPDEPLHSMNDIATYIQAALNRLEPSNRPH